MGDAIFTRCVNSPSVLPIGKGGTGGTTEKTALANLGISDINQMNFQAENYEDWLSKVLTYVDNNSKPLVPFSFQAGWHGVGYGSGFACQTLEEGFKFLILYNQVYDAGVRFFYKPPHENWQETCSIRGKTLYQNFSGYSGTITLSDNMANYEFVEIQYKDSSDRHYLYKIFGADGKKAGFTAHLVDENGVWIRCSDIVFSGNTIWHWWNRQVNCGKDNNFSVQELNDIYITWVKGYK